MDMQHTSSCCVTGHRQYPQNREQAIRAAIRRAVSMACREGYRRFYCGFASGTDLLFADAVLEAQREFGGLELWGILPYRDRMLTADPEFHRLVAGCSQLLFAAERYWRGCELKRDRLMVESSDLVIAVYDGRPSGGTAYTLRCAEKERKEIWLIPV